MYTSLFADIFKPIGPRLPIPVLLMFNGTMKGLMPELSRLPLLFYYDHYAILIEWQQNVEKTKIITCYIFLPIGSTVVVQRAVGHSCQECNKRSYKIRVNNTGCNDM